MKKSDFSVEMTDLAPIWKRQMTPENGWRDAARQVWSHQVMSITCRIVFRIRRTYRCHLMPILASEALAVFGADPVGGDGLACPSAHSSLAIDPQIHPDTAIESGKHFLCDACSQTARFEIAKSVERTKSRKMNSQF